MRRGFPRAILAIALSLATAAPALARKFDVGGHRLHAVRKGRGQPTVVFDAGLGDSLDSWRWVWPEVAKVTSVLLYDRAGLGKSDAGPRPRTSERIVAELEALLRSANVKGPLVLVGHSFGGFNARLFAARHPDRVVGLVLLDATPVDFPERESSLRDEVEHRRLETSIYRQGEGARSEWEAIRDSAAQVRRAPALPDGVLVTVLSSGMEKDPAPLKQAWLELQRNLAEEVRADVHLVLERSDHYVQYDQPDRVVEAIVLMVEQARRLATPGGSGLPSDRP